MKYTTLQQCLSLSQFLCLTLLESGWVVYGPENGYNFRYPRLLRVKKQKHYEHTVIE